MVKQIKNIKQWIIQLLHVLTKHYPNFASIVCLPPNSFSFEVMNGTC